MFILIAILIGLIIGFIRGGSFSSIFNHLYNKWYLGFIGVTIMVILHYSYLVQPLILNFGAYLPILNFLAYILVLLMLLFNLDDLFTILIAVGITLNFIVTFINSGYLPVSDQILSSIPINYVLTQSIYTGMNGIYSLMQPQTLLSFLGMVIPFPFMQSFIAAIGSLPGFSIGDILILIGIAGALQSSMALRKKEPEIVPLRQRTTKGIQRRRVEPVTTERRPEHFESRTEELFFEDTILPEDPLDKIFGEEPKNHTRVIDDLRDISSQTAEAYSSDARTDGLSVEDLTKPLGTGIINSKEINQRIKEQSQEEETFEPLSEEEGFFASSYLNGRSRQEIHTDEIFADTNTGDNIQFITNEVEAQTAEIVLDEGEKPLYKPTQEKLEQEVKVEEEPILIEAPVEKPKPRPQTEEVRRPQRQVQPTQEVRQRPQTPTEPVTEPVAPERPKLEQKPVSQVKTEKVVEKPKQEVEQPKQTVAAETVKPETPREQAQDKVNRIKEMMAKKRQAAVAQKPEPTPEALVEEPEEQPAIVTPVVEEKPEPEETVTIVAEEKQEPAKVITPPIEEKTEEAVVVTPIVEEKPIQTEEVKTETIQESVKPEVEPTPIIEVEPIITQPPKVEKQPEAVTTEETEVVEEEPRKKFGIGPGNFLYLASQLEPVKKFVPEFEPKPEPEPIVEEVKEPTVVLPNINDIFFDYDQYQLLLSSIKDPEFREELENTFKNYSNKKYGTNAITETKEEIEPVEVSEVEKTVVEAVPEEVSTEEVIEETEPIEVVTPTIKEVYYGGEVSLIADHDKFLVEEKAKAEAEKTEEKQLADIIETETREAPKLRDILLKKTEPETITETPEVEETEEVKTIEESTEVETTEVEDVALPVVDEELETVQETEQEEEQVIVEPEVPIEEPAVETTEEMVETEPEEETVETTEEEEFLPVIDWQSFAKLIFEEKEMKRGSYVEEKQGGYIVNKAYKEERSKMDKSEERMMNVWSNLSKENQKKKLERRQQASNGLRSQSGQITRPAQTQPTQQPAQPQAREVVEPAESVKEQKPLETAPESETQRINLMTDEEREKAGYEKVTINFQGNEISFWQKKVSE